MFLNVKLLLSYVGKDYLGFQKNAQDKTIEKELEKALFQVLQTPINLQVASRTDAGVSATGQVVTFFVNKTIDSTKLKRSLNGLLPEDIRVIDADEVTAFFHPSLDSVSKVYVYRICNSPIQSPFNCLSSWHYPFKKIDTNLLKQAASFFIGKKNFSAFTPNSYDDPICHIESIDIDVEEDRFTLTITGDRFLYKMVRTLVGTLVNIATGTLSQYEVKNVFENKERKLAGVTAPSHGLCLKKVFFQEDGYALL